MRTSVHEDFAPDVGAALEDHQDAFLFRQLNDFGWERRAHRTRTARRKTEAFGIVLSFILRVVVVNCGGPGLERNEWLVGRAAALSAIEILGRVRREAREVLDGWQTPDTWFAMIPSE